MNALTIISVITPFVLLLAVRIALRVGPTLRERRLRTEARSVARPTQAKARARAGERRNAERRVA